MRDHFIARLSELAEHDERIVLVTGDLGFKVLDDYRARFPDRFLNVGVAEQNMTAVATGLAMTGRIAFTYSIANFPTLRCFEQLRNDACYHRVDLKVVVIGAGFSYGALGFSHHATEDLAALRALPNCTVLTPGCFWEAEQATDLLVETPGVCVLRLDKSSAGRTGREGERLALGRARVLREGDAATVVSCGGILAEALVAADRLAETGIAVRVLSMPCVTPVDSDALLAAARETGGIVTLEEHNVAGGLGGAVAETLLEAGAPPGFFRRLGLRASFASTVGSQSYLRERYGLDAGSLVAELTAALRGAGGA